jgi:uncharacterized membrane protein
MRTDRVYRAGILATLLGGLCCAGCSTMNNTEKGAVGGGVAGTAIGTAIGAATHHPLLGAAVGAATGTAGGALVGNSVDRDEQRVKDIQQSQAVAVAQAQAQAAQQRMGLADVIKLSQQGLDDQLIINQIRSTGSTFQLTTSDLGMLKTNGVSDRVIAEMQVRSAPPPVPTRVIAAPPPGAVIYDVPPPPGAVIVTAAPGYWYYGGCYYRRWR